MSNPDEVTSPGTDAAGPIHLVLRMRDEKRELQDIKFDFLPNKDTVDEISHELVNAKLNVLADKVHCLLAWRGCVAWRLGHAKCFGKWLF